MKRFILSILICLPTMLWGQNEPKYLEPLPFKDGKINFSTEIKVPASISEEKMYETLLAWANNRFQPKEECNARVLYSDKEAKGIAIGGDEFIIFKNAALSLDQSRIYYQLNLRCEENICKVEMTRIRYWYEAERNGGQKFTAEEWITDEITLNKAKTKMYPKTGKFRRKTIDLKDELFESIRSVLGNEVLAMGVEKAEQAPTTVVTPTSTPTIAETKVAEVATPTPAKKEEPAKDLQVARVTLTAGNDEQFELNKECWGGFGELFGKKVAYCLLDVKKKMGNMLLEQSTHYTINLYRANESEPFASISCKKMMQQSISHEEASKMSPALSADHSYNLYVGEVLE